MQKGIDDASDMERRRERLLTSITDKIQPMRQIRCTMVYVHPLLKQCKYSSKGKEWT